MDTPAPAADPVAQVLGQLLRQPEPLRDVELERALLRLQAARPDAAYLLLHRVMVLETALQQLKPRVEGAATAAAPPAPARTRSFLREAAVVTAGVVAGQALWQGLSDAPAAEGGDGLDIDGWL
jgi:hypothetical protein